MQAQRSSQRLLKANESNSSKKEQEENKKTRMNSGKQPENKGFPQNQNLRGNQPQKKGFPHNLRGKQQLRKGSQMNSKEPNNVENDVIIVDRPVTETNNDDINETILDPSVSQSINKDTSIDMSIFESDTPGRNNGSHALNSRRANKGTNPSVSEPTNKDTSIDMSIFESDTPSRNYGSHGLNLKRANKGKGYATNKFGKQPSSFDGNLSHDNSEIPSMFESDTPGRNNGSHVLNSRRGNKGKGYATNNFGKQPSSFAGNLSHDNSEVPKFASSRGRNITDSERLSYIKYQQKNPRSTFYLPSGSIPKGTPSFGYQENETGLHTTRSKRSLTGVNSQPNKGFELKSSSFCNDSQGGKSVPKNRFGIHSSSFESGSTGMKPQLKKGYGMQTSSVGNFPQAQKMNELRMTHIKNVNPMINNMAIKGRCISIWHSHKLNEEHDPYSLDCVFQDVEDERIQIYIKKEFMFKFEPLLQQGQCYMISNFGVAENGGRLPLLPNRWKISFFKDTNVTRIDQIDDNFVGFINEPFTRILDRNNEYHEHDCVDVIGTVVAVGNIVSINGHSGPKIRRTVVIEDAESYTLDCTFWDNWALMWNEYANRLEDIGHLDILFMLGKIKYWDNKPSVHNALFGSKIYINRKIPQLLSFRESYESQEGYDASEFKIQVHSQDSHVVTPSEFMQGCVKRLVGMIRTIEPQTCCVVYATVHSIQYQNGWVYTGCKQCNTKVTPIAAKSGMNSRNKNQLWFCKRHGETYAVSCRFKIIVRIVDESGTAQIVIFDNNVHKMTKVTAWEIMQEHGIHTDEYFPDELNDIIGKQYLFKIKYTEFNHNNNSHIYRTEKVTDDVDTINHFKDGFLNEEDNEEEFENDDDDYYENYGHDHENNEDDFENGGDESQNSDDDLATGKGEFENGGDKFEHDKNDSHNTNNDLERNDHDYENDEDELVDTEDELEDVDNMNIQASINVDQKDDDNGSNPTEFVNEDTEGENEIDIRNTRMNSVDSLTNNVSGAIGKKRPREIVDESEHETIDDDHAQQNKKMASMNISKEV